MSWWVKEHIAVNEDETKQLCSIEADNQTSLPAADQTATAGFIIARGSDAKDVSTGDKYIMDSTGAWKLQPSGVQLDLSGYATTQDLTDGLAGKVDTSTYTAGQAAQETEIGVVAALGAKNLLQITAESQTKNGVKMAVNADGTLTFTRTATASSDSYFTVATFTGDAGRFYTLTGCPQGGTDSTFYQYIGGTFRDYGSGVTRDGGTLRNVVVFISKNYSPDNLVFKPMLRPAEITDDTFVPYAPTNRELYEMILALQ